MSFRCLKSEEEIHYLHRTQAEISAEKIQQERNNHELQKRLRDLQRELKITIGHFEHTISADNLEPETYLKFVQEEIS